MANHALATLGRADMAAVAVLVLPTRAVRIRMRLNTFRVAERTLIALRKPNADRLQRIIYFFDCLK